MEHHNWNHLCHLKAILLPFFTPGAFGRPPFNQNNYQLWHLKPFQLRFLVSVHFVHIVYVYVVKSISSYPRDDWIWDSNCFEHSANCFTLIPQGLVRGLLVKIFWTGPIFSLCACFFLDCILSIISGIFYEVYNLVIYLVIYLDLVVYLIYNHL